MRIQHGLTYLCVLLFVQVPKRTVFWHTILVCVCVCVCLT